MEIKFKKRVKYVGDVYSELVKTGFTPEGAAELLNNVPDAEVITGIHAKWEECDYVEPCVHGFGTIRHPNAGVKCTHCINVFKKELLWKDNFCPNCGARMDG